MTIKTYCSTNYIIVVISVGTLTHDSEDSVPSHAFYLLILMYLLYRPIGLIHTYYRDNLESQINLNVHLFGLREKTIYKEKVHANTERTRIYSWGKKAV